MGLPSHINWYQIFIRDPKRRNIHEYTVGNDGDTQRRIYVWGYIVTKKVYLWTCTGCILFIQGIYWDYDPQVGFQVIKVGLLAII